MSCGKSIPLDCWEIAETALLRMFLGFVHLACLLLFGGLYEGVWREDFLGEEWRPGAFEPHPLQDRTLRSLRTEVGMSAACVLPKPRIKPFLGAAPMYVAERGHNQSFCEAARWAIS